MQVVQPAHVFMYGSSDEVSGPWTFVAEMPQGTHDMIAVDSMHRMAIRRDIEIQNATTLGPLDFDTEGSAMQPHPIGIVGKTATETARTDSILYTKNQFARIEGTETLMYAPPESLLVAGDYSRFYIEVYDNDERTIRSIVAPTTTTRNIFELPLTIQPNAIDYSILDDERTLRGDWTWLPSFDTVTLYLATASLGQQTAIVTRGFVEATGVKAITLSTPPAFKEGWRINPCGADFNEVRLAQRSSDGIWYLTFRREELLPCFPTHEPPTPI